VADDHESLRARRSELVEEALLALKEANAELGSLVAIQRQLIVDTDRLSTLARQLSHAIPDTQAELRDPEVWQRMQEMNESFSMQYLALQQKMQDENRRFTLLSNIMKTKHDTAKNSISNIR